MAGLGALRDLAPLRATVSVRGVAVDVRPVSIGALVALAQRYKGLAAIFGEGDIVQSVLGEGDRAVAAIIATATGEPEHVALELILTGRIGPVEQASILAAIAECSLPLDRDELLAVRDRVMTLFVRVQSLAPEEAQEAGPESSNG